MILSIHAYSRASNGGSIYLDRLLLQTTAVSVITDLRPDATQIMLDILYSSDFQPVVWYPGVPYRVQT